MIEKIASKRKIKKLLSSRLTLKKAALNFVNEVDFLSKKSIQSVALKSIKSYKNRIKETPSIKSELLNDPRLLIQRVQNEVVLQIKDSIKENYAGEFYIWLPSDAEEADPEHQLNYGKKFQVGDGEMPGDRIGCRCGMEILTKDTELNLE